MAVLEPNWLTGEFPELKYERREDTGPRLDNTKVGVKVDMPPRIEANLRAQFHQRGMDALAAEVKKGTPACVECASVTVEATRESNVRNFDEIVILRARCKEGRCNKRLSYKVTGEALPDLPPAPRKAAPEPEPEPIIVRKPDVPATADDAW